MLTKPPPLQSKEIMLENKQILTQNLKKKLGVHYASNNCVVCTDNSEKLESNKMMTNKSLLRNVAD